MAEDFRDHISTVDEEGKRIWVYPKKPKGKYFNRRQIVAYLLLAFLIIMPFLKFHGKPFLMFNIFERKFIIFGHLFYPQDFFIAAIAMIAGIVFIAVFTVIFGRLFCGWVCPQTVFMEMVFRRIEYLIEGDWTKQKKLDKAPWNTEKIIKKTTKHIIFWLVSFFIANIFLSYIIGVDQLKEIILDNPLNHLGGLIGIAVFTTIFYIVFAFMREQVCTTVCPYGRLQGVLLDRQSMIVAYDHKRGEGEKGRHKFRKNEDRKELGYGDCIDCKQCVHVCPTGIDIRNGTQLECVNCTACMDACDFMMESVGLPTKLIGFKSEESIENNKKFEWSIRSAGYVAALVALLGLFLFVILSRKDFDAVITRTRGSKVIRVDDTHYANRYKANLINKSDKDYVITFELEGINGKITAPDIMLPAEKEINEAFTIIIDKKEFKNGNVHGNVRILGNGKLIDTEEVKVIAPGL